jgi:hypothetical protein
MKKLKDVIKKNPGPVSSGNYSNPSQLGQYSAQNQIAEDSPLEKYLSGKGIEPGSLSRETKSGHARSSEFAKWKQNHMNEDMTVGRTTGSDIRSKVASSPTKKRFSQLKKATGHYQIKPVTTHTQLHGEATKTPSAIPMLHPKHPSAIPVIHHGQLQPHQHPQHSLHGAKAGDSIKGDIGILRKYIVKKVSEDNFSDAQAASRTVLSPGEISEKKKKTLHSFKEDMHDWEKEDKSVVTYGKKPKFDKAEKDLGASKKESAAATLSGGTALTGSKRDVVEIDPMMRNRPGQPDVTKKDEKKKEEKSEKKQDTK